MRSTAVAAVLLFAAVTAPVAHGQEAAETPELSTEQRWARAVSNLNALVVVLIQQGKEHGESAAVVGARMGRLVGPAWSSEPGTGTPRQLVRGMAANLQSWPDAEVAISIEDDGAYVLRHNRPWLPWFGDGATMLGVSVDEFEAMWNAGVRSIGEYLGLAVETRRDGDDQVMTARDAP